MAVFNLLHLSDLHIAKYANRTSLASTMERVLERSDAGYFASHNKTVAEAASAAISKIFDGFSSSSSGIDLIVASGDIATTGEEEDLRSARVYLDRFIASPYLSAFSSKSEKKKRTILLIPGNHDRFSFAGHAGWNFFEIALNNYWPPYEDGRRRRILSKVLDKKDGCLGVVGVDFSLEKNSDATLNLRAHWGQGMASKDTLAALETETGDLRQEHKGICIIWMVHFSPLHGVNRKLMLRNATNVRDAALRLKIPLILCGHIHKSAVTTIGENSEVWCAGSLCQHNEPNGHELHLLELKTSGPFLEEAYRRTFRYRDGSFGGDFFEDQFGVLGKRVKAITVWRPDDSSMPES